MRAFNMQGVNTTKDSILNSEFGFGKRLRSLATKRYQRLRLKIFLSLFSQNPTNIVQGAALE